MRYFSAVTGGKIRDIKIIVLKQILNFLIHHRIYFKTSRVQHEICHTLAVSILLAKIRYHVVDHHIYVPGIYFTALIRRHTKNCFTLFSVLKLLLGNISLRVHLRQDQIATSSVIFGIFNRIIEAWTVCNCRNTRAFGKCQVTYVL